MGKTTPNTRTRLRDKNAPKIPMNAYSRYFKANLSNSRREGKNTREVSSKIAKQWSTMTAEEKKPYFDEYNKEKEVYYERMKEYKETEQYKEFQKIKLEKKKRARRKSRLSIKKNVHQLLMFILQTKLKFFLKNFLTTIKNKRIYSKL
uniref:HMG box domain-containing protein n=1 Tax=Meloidogyne incognita TaxID=6306 RepID=A0A914NAD5_MELIC